MTNPTPCRIVPGGEYLYAAEKPTPCRGHRYRVVRFVVAVPTYQEQVLFEALTGPDAGHWFVCSPANFATRYVPVPVEEAPAPAPAPPMPDRPIGRLSREIC